MWQIGPVQYKFNWTQMICGTLYPSFIWWLSVSYQSQRKQFCVTKVTSLLWGDKEMKEHLDQRKLFCTMQLSSTVNKLDILCLVNFSHLFPPASRDSGNDFGVHKIVLVPGHFLFIWFLFPHVVSSRFFSFR